MTRRLDEIERKLDRIMEELRPTAIALKVIWDKQRTTSTLAHHRRVKRLS
jgi:Holliday junction resolvasome RuvABC endonuclease subunit